ncbi:DUF2938 domain-containing protein [Arenibacter sp. M-2]|uniref:DUF2938 domain-containing protein n=1 Tax=Arenibacter sp. M-2 TaxID=3053612 RepID=UPI002570BBF9|nr:DUF2938 domain-containing protein [Arenibacter sp. M-2]MDL5511107.1 DUF2938 domain-containing protein [Arenibacter sp. M-2]
MNTILKIVAIGIGATFTMDIYAFVLNLFGIKGLDYRFLGRWIGHLFNGKFYHDKIFDSTPIKYEQIIGQVSHYSIGIFFAFLLVATFGKKWLDNPTLFPALVIGLFTMVAPFFIMQPAFGFGVAGTHLPDPNKARLMSLIIHCVYGFGLFAIAFTINSFFPYKSFNYTHVGQFSNSAKSESYHITFHTQANKTLGKDNVLQVSGIGVRGFTDSTDNFEKIKKVNLIKYETVVISLGDDSFTEKGNIIFGNNDTLKIETKGKGAFKKMEGGKVVRGAVMWDIIEGTGRFSKTTGFITTNFHFDPVSGKGKEEQVGVLFHK